jgi:hypothetical protein
MYQRKENNHKRGCSKGSRRESKQMTLSKIVEKLVVHPQSTAFSANPRLLSLQQTIWSSNLPDIQIPFWTISSSVTVQHPPSTSAILFVVHNFKFFSAGNRFIYRAWCILHQMSSIEKTGSFLSVQLRSRKGDGS